MNRRSSKMARLEATASSFAGCNLFGKSIDEMTPKEKQEALARLEAAHADDPEWQAWAKELDAAIEKMSPAELMAALQRARAARRHFESGKPLPLGYNLF